MEGSAEDPLRIAKLAGVGVVLVVGWLFVLWTNKFHITAPVVFVCLGYLAVVMTVVNLWRTGAAAAAPDGVDDEWGRPIGAQGELEKEKRTLLKAIKEAEFDLAMGKLSKYDSDALIRQYRSRAIDVIKELDRLGDTAELTTREQIQREVRARIELAAQDKPSKRAKNLVEKKAAAAEARAAKAAAKPGPEGEQAAKPVVPPSAAAATADDEDDDGDDDAAGVDDGVVAASSEPVDHAPAPAASTGDRT